MARVNYSGEKRRKELEKQKKKEEKKQRKLANKAAGVEADAGTDVPESEDATPAAEPDESA
jgi:hypothetical protein